MRKLILRSFVSLSLLTLIGCDNEERIVELKCFTEDTHPITSVRVRGLSPAHIKIVGGSCEIVRIYDQ